MKTSISTIDTQVVQIDKVVTQAESSLAEIAQTKKDVKAMSDAVNATTVELLKKVTAATESMDRNTTAFRQDVNVAVEEIKAVENQVDRLFCGIRFSFLLHDTCCCFQVDGDIWTYVWVNNVHALCQPIAALVCECLRGNIL